MFSGIASAANHARFDIVARRDKQLKGPRCNLRVAQDVVASGDKSRQDQAKQMLGMIDAINVAKEGEQTGKALQDLWQDAKKLDTGVPAAKK